MRLSPALYTDRFLTAKNTAYFSELEKSIVFIRDSPHLSIDEKRRFFKSANANLGTTALCLSGGASFGYCSFKVYKPAFSSETLTDCVFPDHFGVVKAFFDAGLLPRVISGTSAGGLIAAFACCYTDEELKVMLVPELADKITACEESVTVWMKRFLKTGARFDSVAWARKARRHSLTSLRLL